MTTLLVTGAAGFIGSHLVEALLRRGDAVVGLDSFDPYYDPEAKRRNLREVRALAEADRALTFVEGDVRDRHLLRDLLASHDVDVVVHLAGLAGVRASIDRPAAYVDVNVGGSTALLEAVREVGVAHVVFASSSSVYGRTEDVPFVETAPCDRPLCAYAATKRAVEMLGHTYHHLYGTSFTALRFFTVYGPRNRPDMMAHKLLDSAFHGREVPLYAGGRMHRDWTFVDDVIGGVVAAADRPLGYEVLNIGRGQPILLADFVAQVEAFAGRKANLVEQPMMHADVPYTFADTSKAGRLLDYRPTMSIAEGVRATGEWFVRTAAASATAES
ncbi:MAG: NAD-dependent epimerase/dehydratase family protein [Myxococcota bacterium]